MIFEQDRGKCLMVGLSRQADIHKRRGYFQQRDIRLSKKEVGPHAGMVLPRFIL